MGSVLNCTDRQSGATGIARQNPCQAGLSSPISDDAPMTRAMEQLIEYRYPGKGAGGEQHKKCYSCYSDDYSVLPRFHGRLC
jgi:hypothetical protein